MRKKWKLREVASGNHSIVVLCIIALFFYIFSPMCMVSAVKDAEEKEGLFLLVLQI